MKASEFFLHQASRFPSDQWAESPPENGLIIQRFNIPLKKHSFVISGFEYHFPAPSLSPNMVLKDQEGNNQMHEATDQWGMSSWLYPTWTPFPVDPPWIKVPWQSELCRVWLLRPAAAKWPQCKWKIIASKVKRFVFVRDSLSFICVW